jgi:hypothetical protein
MKLPQPLQGLWPHASTQTGWAGQLCQAGRLEANRHVRVLGVGAPVWKMFPSFFCSVRFVALVLACPLQPLQQDFGVGLESFLLKTWWRWQHCIVSLLTLQQKLAAPVDSLCMQYCRVLLVHGRVRHHLLPLPEPGLLVHSCLLHTAVQWRTRAVFTNSPR